MIDKPALRLKIIDHLRGKPVGLTSREVSMAISAPIDSTEKCLRDLRKAGLVSATSGARGLLLFKYEGDD